MWLKCTGGLVNSDRVEVAEQEGADVVCHLSSGNNARIANTTLDQFYIQVGYKDFPAMKIKTTGA